MKGIIFLIIVISLPLFSQTDEIEKINTAGRFALMFQVDKNFDLTSFEGMNFGGKYCLSNQWHLRLGFELNSSNVTDKSSSTFPGSGAQDTGFERENDSFLIGFTLNMIYNFEMTDNIRFYTGAGPYYFYNDQDFRHESSAEKTLGNTVSKGYGFQALTGVEWFVKNNISLSAEYGFRYTNSSHESEGRIYLNDQLDTVNKIERDDNRITDLPVALGVSIYF